jgi:hypothetical protein
LATLHLLIVVNEPEATSSLLMVQCSKGTSSHEPSKVDLTDRRAHDLAVDLHDQRMPVLTRRRLGTILAHNVTEEVDSH